MPFVFVKQTVEEIAGELDSRKHKECYFLNHLVSHLKETNYQSFLQLI